MLKTVWNDPVWSKVIAGVVLAALATVGTYLFDWWPSIGRAFAYVFSFSVATTELPNWLLGIFAVLALPTFVVMLVIGWQVVRPSREDGPSWQDYKSDTFFGLRWRWKYFDNGQIWDVHTFCPHCDFQVFPENASAWDAIDRIRFRCDSCHTDIGEFQESFESLENKTKRFVQQKIRNGSWHGSTDEPTATRQESP